MDERGISPIVATILLIAITVIAAGVIAAYVSGMYVGGTTVIAGTADGTVYDYDNGAAVDNYRNGNVALTVTLTSGRLRNIGDTRYGTVIDLANTKTGFHASLSLGDETGSWGGTIDNTQTIDSVEITVRIPTDTTGRFLSGSTMTIIMKPHGADFDNNDVNFRGTETKLWEDAETINVIISGRDTLSLTGYDGAYLGASRWTV